MVDYKSETRFISTKQLLKEGRAIKKKLEAFKEIRKKHIEKVAREFRGFQK